MGIAQVNRVFGTLPRAPNLYRSRHGWCSWETCATNHTQRILHRKRTVFRTTVYPSLAPAQASAATSLSGDNSRYRRAQGGRSSREPGDDGPWTMPQLGLCLAAATRSDDHTAQAVYGRTTPEGIAWAKQGCSWLAQGEIETLVQAIAALPPIASPPG